MNILQRVFTRIIQSSDFFKSVSLLAGGTLFAQVINVVTLPILTRIYSPSDFSLFAIFNSLLMTFTVVSCLRFEIAIPLANDDREANNLTLLALISNFFLSLIVLIIIFVFPNEVGHILNIENSKFVMLLLPFSLFSLGLYNIFQYRATREKSFKVISKTKISQALSGITIQIGMGLVGITGLGLIIGQIVKYSAGSLSLVKEGKKNFKNLFINFNTNNIFETLVKNQNYPKFSSIEALANAAAIQIPIIIISNNADRDKAGHLMLAMQVMAIPLMLVGNAISQVYISHVKDELKRGQLKKYTYDCILKIIKVGVLPLVLICSFSPYIFPIVFGDKWNQSGTMILWMLPWYAMQLLVSPISIVLYVVHCQKIALIIQLIGLLIRLAGTYFVSLKYTGYVFEYYAVSGFVFYLVYFVVVMIYIDFFGKVSYKFGDKGEVK